MAPYKKIPPRSTIGAVFLLLLLCIVPGEAMTGKPPLKLSPLSLVTGTTSSQIREAGFPFPKKIAPQQWREKTWNATHAAGQDCVTGVLELHNRYLEVIGASWWTNCRVAVPTVAIFWALQWGLGDAWTNVYRVGFAKALFWLGCVCEVPQWLVRAPVLALRGGVSVRKVLSGIFSFGRRELFVASMPQPFFLESTVCFPILEEAIYRWGSLKLWRRLRGRNNVSEEPLSDSQTESQGDSSNEDSAWIIASSLVYACAHIGMTLSGARLEKADEILGNDLAVADSGLSKDDPRFEAGVKDGEKLARFLFGHAPFLNCLSGGVLVYTMSSRILAPVFLNRGLVGSIAAQAFWNMSALFNHLQIPARLLFLGIRKTRGSV